MWILIYYQFIKKIIKLFVTLTLFGVYSWAHKDNYNSNTETDDWEIKSLQKETSHREVKEGYSMTL